MIKKYFDALRSRGWSPPADTSRRRAALGPALLAIAGLCALAAPAQAAITVNSVVVSADGTGPFDANNDPGNDSGPSNGVARTQDSILYTIGYNASDASNSIITATLPAGMRWDPTATAASVCNGPGGGSLNAARTVLTCNRQPASAGVESFQVRAWVGNVANGATVALTAASGASSAASPAVTVSATPKTDTRTRTEPGNIDRAETAPGSGIWLRRMPVTISLGALLPASGNLKGYEALQNPVTVSIKVQPGAVVTNCPATATCTQPGGAGTDVVVQFNNPVTHFLDAVAAGGFEATWRQTASVIVQIGVPEIPNFPAGQSSFITAQLVNFAPLGLGGQPSAVPAPGYQPGFTCPVNTALNNTQTCIGAVVSRTQPVQLSLSGGAVYDAASFLYGDGNGFTQGAEKLLPGQTFNALIGLGNRPTSEDPATDAQSCVAWDPALLELRAPSSLKMGNTVLFYQPVNLTQPDVPAADMVIEYSAQPYADNNARRITSCGVAGDGNLLWTSIQMRKR